MRGISISKWLAVAIVAVMIVGALTFGLLFSVQDATQTTIRQSLFEQQQQRQIDTTRSLAQHTGADLNLMLTKLEAMANLNELQGEDFDEPAVRDIAERYFAQLGRISFVDYMFILDSEDLLRINVARPGVQNFEGADLSFRDYVQKTRLELRPVFSDGYEGLDGKYRISLTYPIVNRSTGEFVGMIGITMPTAEFFSRYGNIYGIQSQYVAVLDTKANHLIHGNPDLIGRNFFDEYTQQFTLRNEQLNSAMRQVLSGKPAYALYSIEAGERLTTGHPISVDGKLVYVVFVVTPTSAIYSQIDRSLADQGAQLFWERAGMTAALGLFVVFVAWLNSRLNKEVKNRTVELEASNRQLEVANEQLKSQEKMQKEFINIAAHELRTPIQPILGMAEMLEAELVDKKDNFQIIARNARRLGRLTEDILDVTRIESNSLHLHPERFDLKEVIEALVGEYPAHRLLDGNVRFSCDAESVIINANKNRIIQVLSNLLDNSIKFTEKGEIAVMAQLKDGHAIVRVSDTGRGIDPEIMPRLFSKFATKSDKGTGLGLFISKSIVEAHGGMIWAENNPGRKGATFTFSIPRDNAARGNL